MKPSTCYYNYNLMQDTCDNSSLFTDWCFMFYLKNISVIQQLKALWWEHSRQRPGPFRRLQRDSSMYGRRENQDGLNLNLIQWLYSYSKQFLLLIGWSLNLRGRILKQPIVGVEHLLGEKIKPFSSHTTIIQSDFSIKLNPQSENGTGRFITSTHYLNSKPPFLQYTDVFSISAMYSVLLLCK